MKEEIVKEVVKLVNLKFPDSEIYLYGSHARGEANPLSDWDVLVLLNAEKISFEIETDLMDDFYEIELQTGGVISPLIYTKNNWEMSRSFTPLYENIQKEGVRIK